MPKPSAIETIKLQRERFLAFSFAMADLLIELDAEGRIVFIAGACRRFFGLDDASLMGRPLIDRITGRWSGSCCNASTPVAACRPSRSPSSGSGAAPRRHCSAAMPCPTSRSST
jgi:transcriptional regulator with PAS, ATPase and Fis domain